MPSKIKQQAVTLDSAHTYRIHGQSVISVTQVLTEAGLIDKIFFTEAAMERGHIVHFISQFVGHDNPRPAIKIPENIKNYILAWQAFLRDTRFAVELTEHRAYSPAFRLAGTIDRVGKLRGHETVLEIKTGSGPYPWWGLQLAGYNLLLAKKPRLKRVAVQLRADGSYRLHRYADSGDERVFLAALAVARWKTGL